MNKKITLILFISIICVFLSSCTNSARLPENITRTQLFYYRFSMAEPYTWIEKEFQLSEEQQKEIYSSIQALNFSKTNHSITHDTRGTSLDQIVVIFWDDGVGHDYYFYDGRIFYEDKQKTYAAEDNGKIVSTLRRWTAGHFPELNEENF